MIPNLLLVSTLLLSQSSPSGSAVVRFAKPSEAFTYANSQMAEWKAAVKAGRPPKTSVAPQAEAWNRAKALCPSFTVESISGEELYWLAELCRPQPALGLSAVQRYLAGSGQEHRPDAHLLLSEMQLRTTRSWVSSWETFRTILQEDPIGPDQAVVVRTAIDEEADEDEAKALQWSEERYSLLSERLQHPKPGIPVVSAGWVILAGADLAHRYYLTGKTDQATRVLAVVNSLEAQNAVEVGWPAEHLNWANMETKPAPPIPVLYASRGSRGPDIVRRGRVEVVSFFFLHCTQCLYELPALNDLQKRYPKDKVLVVDVTTYKAASQPDVPPHNEVESAIEKLRHKKSPGLEMALTIDKVLGDYGIGTFPVLAVIDKAGRLRYSGFTSDLDSGEQIDRLVRRLLNEQVQP